MIGTTGSRKRELLKNSVYNIAVKSAEKKRTIPIFIFLLLLTVNSSPAAEPADTNITPDKKALYERYKTDNSWSYFAANLLIPGFGNFGWGSSMQGDTYGAQLEFDCTIIGGGAGLLIWAFGYYLSPLMGKDAGTIIQTGGLVILGGGFLGGYGTGLVRPFIYQGEANRKLRKEIGLSAAIVPVETNFPILCFRF